MKIRTAFLMALAAASTAWASEAVPLTFNAVLSMGKDKRFGVATEDAKRSAWLPVGGEFEGFVIKSFDEAAQTLILEHEGATYRLPIADGGIQTLTTKATFADAAEVMNQMHFEQMLQRMIEQQKKALVGVSKQLMGASGSHASSEESAALQAKILDTLWAQLKPEELKQEMTRAYAEIFSKDELHAMTQFYASAPGQALLEKQPEVQERLLAVMMPRMMQAMPQIQELQRDFAAQHANNPAAAKP